MKNISVFCAASTGKDTIYAVQATLTGKTIARRGYGLVYGGARIGLMGAVAEGALSEGGKVIGVLPDFMRDKEVQHNSLTELIGVENMHERKMMMHKLSEGVIALPGGYGTLEELFEMLTWAQLSIHTKPIGILNIEGYYDPMITLFDTMVDRGFLKSVYRDFILMDNNIESLLDKMENYNYIPDNKWSDVN